MIETRQQAEALHAAIEAREDAWNRFHNAALMPAHQTPDDRLVQTANIWIAAERAVAELSHGVGVDTSAVAEAISPKPRVRRGRPPKAKAAPEQTAAAAGTRTEEEVRAATGITEVGPADPAAAEAAAQQAKGEDDFVAGGSNPQPGDAE